jgi:hypothetical protein
MAITKTKKDYVDIIGKRDLNKYRENYWWEWGYYDFDDDDSDMWNWREEYMALEWYELNNKIEQIFNVRETLGDLIKK